MIIKNKNLLGESPIWNNFNNKFYCVDIIDKKIKSFDDNSIEIFNLDKMPTCLSVIDSSKLLTVVEDGIGIYDFRNNSYNYMLKIDASKVRFNDGKCDKNGILHIGTMDRNEKECIGSIYKYENNQLIELIPNIGISNGIAFSKDNKIMYHSDSLKGEIYQNNNLFYKYENISPDGATVDDYDNYYSCLWGGSRIDIFNEFKLDRSINLSVTYPTCCCFGGSVMDKLFITSASILDNTGDNGFLTIKNND